MMLLLAQTPDLVLQRATSTGWEAGLIALVFLLILGFLVWLIKQWLVQAGVREDRMAKRIDVLEDALRTSMADLVRDCREALDRNSSAITSLQSTLDKRPCLLSSDGQDKVLNGIVTALRSQLLLPESHDGKRESGQPGHAVPEGGSR